MQTLLRYQVINGFVEAMVSVKRIGRYLDLAPTDRKVSFDDVYDEIEGGDGGGASAGAASTYEESDAVICLKNVSFSPSAAEVDILDNYSLEGEFSDIPGFVFRTIENRKFCSYH